MNDDAAGHVARRGENNGVEGDGKRHLRVMHPTMSSAGLLLLCQWPWGKPVSAEPLDKLEGVEGLAVWSPGRVLSETPEANYGSAIHEALAARIISPPKRIKLSEIARKWGIEDGDALKSFRAHAEEAIDTFIRWMVKKNPWGVNLAKTSKIRTEMSIAYNIEKGTARLTGAPTADTHEYRGIEPGEMAGTSDVCIDEIQAGGDGDLPDLIIIDHKTGDGWDMPAENAQLKSLGLANAVRIGAKNVALGIFHSGTEDSSTMYIDELGREEISAFRKELKSAWRRIGDGSLRPGPHCSFCPAATICPTQAGAIVQVETSLSMTPERVGEIEMKLHNFMKTAKKYDEELDAWVKKYGIPSADGSRAVPRPDGKWYRLKRVKREGWQISTKALREVLGIEKAEEIIKALKAAGHLKDMEYDDPRVVNDT